MSFVDRVTAMQNRVARHFEGTTVQVVATGASTYSTSLGVTLSATSMTLPCSVPRRYTAEGADGDLLRSGTVTVLVDRSDAALTFEPQTGQIATVSGEQYRIETVDYLPGAIRLHLRGAAAEGQASA